MLSFSMTDLDSLVFSSFLRFRTNTPMLELGRQIRNCTPEYGGGTKSTITGTESSTSCEIE